MTPDVDGGLWVLTVNAGLSMIITKAPLCGRCPLGGRGEGHVGAGEGEMRLYVPFNCSHTPTMALKSESDEMCPRKPGWGRKNIQNRKLPQKHIKLLKGAKKKKNRSTKQIFTVQSTAGGIDIEENGRKPGPAEPCSETRNPLNWPEGVCSNPSV